MSETTQTPPSPKGLRTFLSRKGVTLSAKRYFVDAMGTMALGLFASLLIGTIFGTLAKYIPWDVLALMAQYSKLATGAVLGVAVAYALQAPPLVLFSAGAVGLCGNDFAAITIMVNGAEKSVTAGPAGAFLCALIAVEIGKLVSKETKVDILVTPFVTIGVGIGMARLLCPAIAYLMYWLGYFVNYATTVAPLPMGILISVVVGIILTLPISSAALCAMIGISGLAGGAAAVGCCAQMIGFAVISYRENRFAGLVAQGLGTSMLQMGNIVKNPRIWIAPTLAAAVTGALSTCVFRLECTGVSAGMGTCGMVGPIGIFTDMGFTPMSVCGTVLLCLLMPALLSVGFNLILRRIGWVKPGDMKLEL